MDILIGVIGVVGSLLILGAAFLCGAYAYRAIGDEERVLAAFWSGATAFLISLVFFRALPDFIFAFAGLTGVIFGVLFAINFVVLSRARARRRKTFLAGLDI